MLHPSRLTSDAQAKVVVGIGASAGGLTAIAQVLAGLDPSFECACVVIQHRAGGRSSALARILARETRLQVCDAVDGARLVSGQVHVVPGGVDATIDADGFLRLEPAERATAPRPSINRFYVSLAQRWREGAIAVLLSGTGADGSAGLRAVQAAGGTTIVQDPATARYDGMPRAAIAAGAADLVLPPAQIARHVAQLLDDSLSPQMPDGADAIEAILSCLRRHAQIDLHGYRRTTLLRRIQRRLAGSGCKDLASYARLLEGSAEEREHLARDVLISVTSFLRDPVAFADLRRALQTGLQAPQGAAAPPTTLRVWVAGCATGEEAYTVAMMYAELLGPTAARERVRIFATDVDERALAVARRGRYPAAAQQGLSMQQREQLFVRPDRDADAQAAPGASDAAEPQWLQVQPHLRDMVVFTRHNVVSDPPFLRLDLVTCRNLLIYYDAAVQAQVLQALAFGLLPGGLLLLGRSESVARCESSFVPVARRSRLFRRTAGTPGAGVAPAASTAPGQTPSQAPSSLPTSLLSTPSSQPTSAPTSAPTAAPTVAPTAAPTSPLSLLSPTPATTQVGNGTPLAAPWLPSAGPAIATAPRGARSDASAADDTSSAQASDSADTGALSAQLAALHVQMRSLAEAAQASNEEFQATNEELESANEELQATNEELSSLNEELQRKSSELAALAGEYAHLYDALTFPVLVFDRALSLMRFNLSASHTFGLRTTALRQPLHALRLDRAQEPLQVLLHQALHARERQETTISLGGRTMLLTATPAADTAGHVVTLVVSVLDVSEIVRAREELQESQLRLALLMESTQVLFAMRDAGGRYLYVNPQWQRVLGLEDRQVIGRTDYELLPESLAHELWACDMQALRDRRTVTRELRVSAAGAQGVRWLRMQHQAVRDATGAPKAFMIEGEDISVAKHAEEQLRISARVFDQSGDAIVVCDPEGLIQTANAAFLAQSGFTLDELTGERAGVFRSERHSPEFFARMKQELAEAHFWQGEMWTQRKGGQSYASWTTITRIDAPDGGVEHYVAVFSAMERLRGPQRKSDFLATHDVLTGLPNRELFQDRLRQALARARRMRQQAAVMFVDLDNFKQINDAQGHEAGDQLLQLLAERLRGTVRDVDTVARQGGDEFIIIVSECDPATAEHVARRIVEELSAPVPLGGREVVVSASIGVALYPDDGEDSAALIRAADSAMYSAKDLGRNRVVFFKPALQARLMRHAAVELALREALRDHRLQLHYQPKFMLGAAGEARAPVLVGAEALVRWHDPQLGVMQPSEFIAIAEKSSLILAITQEVQRLLFEQLAAWRTLGLPSLPMALNVSPRSIREPEFSGQLLAQLRERDLPCDGIVVEITEGALLETSGAVIDNLAQLETSGLGLAIDDFGTGYSSLGYLKRLPISELKIDKSFVDGLGQNLEDEAIARAVLGLAKALNLRTVAEGVETDLQLQWLVRHGCDFAQGFLLGRPMPAERFEDLLAAHGRERQHAARGLERAH